MSLKRGDAETVVDSLGCLAAFGLKAVLVAYGHHVKGHKALQRALAAEIELGGGVEGNMWVPLASGHIGDLGQELAAWLTAAVADVADCGDIEENDALWWLNLNLNLNLMDWLAWGPRGTTQLLLTFYPHHLLPLQSQQLILSACQQWLPPKPFVVGQEIAIISM